MTLQKGLDIASILTGDSTITTLNFNLISSLLLSHVSNAGIPGVHFSNGKDRMNVEIGEFCEKFSSDITSSDSFKLQNDDSSERSRPL
jgi:hypothetical protein